MKTALFNTPLFLLLSTGLLLGLNIPLGKEAGLLGVDPVFWSLVISLVPGIVLLLVSRGAQMRHIPFGFAAGLTAYVVPNLIAYTALPRVGAGYVGLMFAISPVVTALLSVIFNIRPPDRMLLLSVGFGFAGAVLIILNRQKLSSGADTWWPLLAFVIPVSLACGNVYRTARWPKDASPMQVGALANLGAVPPLVAALFYSGGHVGTAAMYPWLIVAQILLSLAMFGVFFRLQWVGGPTYLSQIGYVAAGVGLLFGTLWFGERYPWPVWVGAALIAVGIVVSNAKALRLRPS